MGVMIEGLQIQSVSFCGYNNMAILLEKLGYDFVNDLLGIEWGFCFHRRYDIGICEEYEKWLPDYYISSEINTVKFLMEDYLSIRTKHVISKEIEEYIKKLKWYITEGKPTIVAVDVKHLKYFVEYQKSHSESYHYVTVHGYDENNIYFIDSSRSFVEGEEHSVTYNEFYNMIQPEENIFHIKLEFIVLEEISKKIVKGGSLGKEYFIKSIDIMQQKITPIYECGWVKYTGLNALKEFSKEMGLISKFGDEELIKGYMKKMFPMLILCCQQRKGNIAYLKKEICIELGENSEVVLTMCKGLNQAWENLKIVFYNVRKESWKVVAEHSSVIIDDIYKREQELLCFIQKKRDIYLGNWRGDC